MSTVPRVLAFAAAAAVVGALDGGAARLLMRGIALTMYQRPAFGLSATLFIALTFVVCALPLGVTAALTTRRVPRVLAGALGTLLLAFLSVSIGSQELVVAGLLSGLRWAALAACTLGFGLIVAVQPWLVIRAIRLVERLAARRAGALPAPSVQ